MSKPNPWFEFFRDLTAIGGFTFFFIIILTAFLLQQNQLALTLTLGLIFQVLMVILIRLVYFKERPKKQEYQNFIEKIDASSFPSLHTARIFFLALTLGSFFQQSYLSSFFILLAGLISYSRIYLKKHDWWDLLGGVVLAGITFWVAGI